MEFINVDNFIDFCKTKLNLKNIYFSNSFYRLNSFSNNNLEKLSIFASNILYKNLNYETLDKFILNGYLILIKDFLLELIYEYKVFSNYYFDRREKGIIKIDLIVLKYSKNLEEFKNNCNSKIIIKYLKYNYKFFENEEIIMYLLENFIEDFIEIFSKHIIIYEKIKYLKYLNYFKGVNLIFLNIFSNIFYYILLNSKHIISKSFQKNVYNFIELNRKKINNFLIFESKIKINKLYLEYDFLEPYLLPSILNNLKNKKTVVNEIIDNNLFYLINKSIEWSFLKLILIGLFQKNSFLYIYLESNKFFDKRILRIIRDFLDFSKIDELIFYN